MHVAVQAVILNLGVLLLIFGVQKLLREPEIDEMESYFFIQNPFFRQKVIFPNENIVRFDVAVDPT